MTRRGRRAAATAVAALALAHAAFVGRPVLWADEHFSLAMATGHSLEHPAAAARPERGDFVEARAPRTAGDYAALLRHDDPPAPPARVLRAVRLSDTSPPLYYLLLHLWTRAAGTSDAALHAFGLAAFLLAVPLVWRLGRAAGGARAACAAAGTFALVPFGVLHSIQGRMYALVWLESALLLLLSARPPRSPARWAAWTAAAAAALATHYFTVFVVAACAAHLLRRRRTRVPALVAAGAAALLVLPWYAGLPRDLGRWRVTGGWLEFPLAPLERLAATARLAFAWFAPGPGQLGAPGAKLVAAALAVAALVTAARLRRRALAGPRALLALAAAAACLGPLAVDLAQGTSTVAVPRYALAGLPAGCALVGVAAARVPRALALALGAACVVPWLGGWRALAWTDAWELEPYRDAARWTAAATGPEDLVLVHSIPSGVAGIARYLPPERPLVDWVGQLGTRRAPDDVAAFARGRGRVAFVEIHHVGAPAPELEWLRAHGELEREWHARRARVLVFRPRGGGTFDA